MNDPNKSFMDFIEKLVPNFELLQDSMKYKKYILNDWIHLSLFFWNILYYSNYSHYLFCFFAALWNFNFSIKYLVLIFKSIKRQINFKACVCLFYWAFKGLIWWRTTLIWLFLFFLNSNYKAYENMTGFILWSGIYQVV